MLSFGADTTNSNSGKKNGVFSNLKNLINSILEDCIEIFESNIKVTPTHEPVLDELKINLKETKFCLEPRKITENEKKNSVQNQKGKKYVKYFHVLFKLYY